METGFQTLSLFTFFIFKFVVKNHIKVSLSLFKMNSSGPLITFSWGHAWDGPAGRPEASPTVGSISKNPLNEINSPFVQTKLFSLAPSVRFGQRWAFKTFACDDLLGAPVMVTVL